MSKLLFDVKGEFYKGERIYAVPSPKFYLSFQSSFLGKEAGVLLHFKGEPQHNEAVREEVGVDTRLLAERGSSSL